MHLHHCSRAGRLPAGRPRLRPRRAGGRATPTAIMVGGPSEGTKAPEFSLALGQPRYGRARGSPYELWRDRGKTVVIAFYPADFTKGCTAELQTFGDQYDTLFGSDVVVLGISADSLESHRRFAASLDLPVQAAERPRPSRSPGSTAARATEAGTAGRSSWSDRTAG